MQQRHALSHRLTSKPCDAGNVVFGVVQTGDDFGFYRVRTISENNWYGLGRCLGRKRRRRSADCRDDRDAKIIN